MNFIGVEGMCADMVRPHGACVDPRMKRESLTAARTGAYRCIPLPTRLAADDLARRQAPRRGLRRITSTNARVYRLQVASVWQNRPFDDRGAARLGPRKGRRRSLCAVRAGSLCTCRPIGIVARDRERRRMPRIASDVGESFDIENSDLLPMRIDKTALLQP